MLIKDPPVELVPKLWMLGTNPYPVYLVRGDCVAALFEGSIAAMGPVLQRQIEQLGVPAELVRQIVITHAHPDHVMAVPLLRQMFPGAEVLASAVAAETLAAEKALTMFCRIDQALAEALVRSGIVSAAECPQPASLKAIPVDRQLAEGDSIAVDGFSFRVLRTPGHSPCSLSFHEPDQRILLVSDATGYYMPEQNAWWPNYFADYAEYLASIRRLASLGAEVLCLSHNGVIRGSDDVAAYFAACLAATEAYHQRICEAVKSGTPVRQLAEQLGSEIYAHTQVLPLDFFQKNCGVLIKQSLRHENISVDK